MVEFLDGVPGCLVHDLQQSLLLLQHLSPLDLDLNGLALACGRDSGLLQHGCTETLGPLVRHHQVMGHFDMHS